MTNRRVLRMILTVGLILAGPALDAPLACAPASEGPAEGHRTVAELLGFQPGEKLLIVHADDAGMCRAHNRATMEGMQRGSISSASIMVPCPWILEIIEFAQAHPEADFGVHLTLNSEWKSYRWRPVAPWDKVKGLLDAQGFLPRGVAETALRASALEVEMELRAQVQRAVDLGLKPTHLDTHMGTVFARPDFLAAYRKIAREFGLPCMIPRLSAEEIRRLSPALRPVAQQIGRDLFEAGEVTLDRLDGGYSGSGPLAEQKAYYVNLIRTLRPGITQVIIHPAIDGDELAAITGSHARRDGDFRIFTDPEISNLLREQRVRLVTWREIGRRQAEYRTRRTQKPGPN